MRKLGLILLIAVLVSVLPGCGVATTNINGHGSVQLLFGMLSDGPFVPGEATFNLNFACYAQNNNRMQGYVNWNDPANGVRISAILPETPVKNIGIPGITTCKALKAAASTLGFSVNVAGIYSEDGNANGDMGTQTGMVAILVAKPGVPLPNPVGSDINCGETGTAFLIAEQLISAGNPVYTAGGCLDRGKIVFGSGGQNGQ